MPRWMSALLSLAATLLALVPTPGRPLRRAAIAVRLPPLDRFGDPLPLGAVARLGTIRLRHSSAVECLAYSADGRFLATGSWNGEMRLWDAASGKLVRDFEFVNTSNNIIRAVALSPDGRLLAAGQGELALWDVATGQKRLVIQQRPPGWLTALTFSPDGRALAVCTSQSPKVWLYDTTSGQPWRNFAGQDTGPCDAT